MDQNLEDSLRELEQIFPTIPKNDLANVLAENDMQLDRAIDAIFSREATTGNFEVENQSQPSPTAASEINSSSYRGTRCLLPPDFLRPPGWKRPQAGDEEIAMMLQNEIYGERPNRSTSALPPGFIMRSISDNPRRSVQQPTAIGRPDVVNQIPEAMPNLGILKTLNSGYDFTKRNLGMLATKISTIATPAPGHSTDRELNSPSESRRLVDEDNEEDPMDEVISFEDTNTAQRSRHILDDASQSQQLQQQQQSSSANGATTSSTHVLI